MIAAGMARAGEFQLESTRPQSDATIRRYGRSGAMDLLENESLRK